MNIIRKLLVASLVTLFSLFLFSAALSGGVNRTVGTSGKVKHILAESGIYDTVLPSVLDQTKQIDTSAGEISLENPQIKAAAQSAFTPQFIQTSTESVIDSVFDWLNGKTATPQFKIDLSGPK